MGAMTPLPSEPSAPPGAQHDRLILGLAVFSVFSVPLLLGLRYGGLDHSLVHLGIQCALRAGDGLALDAAMGGGSPLLAEPQSGVAYPITWLLWPVSNAEVAASLWTVVHLAVGAWSAALLGARSGLSRSGALALGAAYALSGTVLNLILHGAYISGAAWTPLVWAGAIGTFARVPRRRGPVEVAVGLGMLLLAGEPQGFAIASALVVAELARARPPWRIVALGVAAGGLGVMVGLAQWLPTFGLRDAIARTGGMDFADQTLWSLGMPEALGIVWPGVTQERFSSGATLFHLWTGVADTRVPWNPTPYVGVVVASLGLGAAWASKRTRWWALGGSVLLLIALGANTPVYGIVSTLVPPMGLFRYPSKYFAPASLALLLATFHVLQHAERQRAVAWALGAGAVLSLAGLGWVAMHQADLQAVSDAFTFGVRTQPGVRSEPGPLLLQRGLQATAMVGLLALVWLRRPRLAPWVVVADLALAAPMHVEVLEPILGFDAPRTHLGDARSTLLCTDPAFPSSRLDTPDRDWGLSGVTLVQRMQHKANLHQCGGPAVPQHYLSSATKPTVTLWHQYLSEPDTRVAAAVALGCTHLAAREPVPGTPVPDDTPPAIAPPVTRLDEVTDAPVVVVEPALHDSVDAALAAAMAETGRSAVLRHIDDPSAQLTAAALPAGAGTVTVTEDALERLALAAGPTGVVVFRRPWWPGWEARSGTRTLPVVRAAGARLAVVIEEPGDVELVYRPPLWMAGWAAGGLGWLGVLGMWIGLGRINLGASASAGAHRTGERDEDPSNGVDGSLADGMDGHG